MITKRKAVRGFVLLSILSLCGFSCVYTAYTAYIVYSGNIILPHDLKFNNYKKAFGEIHHPEHTNFVAKYELLGVLDYQRVMYKKSYTQGCEYVVGEIREYTGTKESIEAFYAKQTFLAEQKEEEILVWFIPTDEDGRLYGGIEYGPVGRQLLHDISGSSVLDPFKSYYFVFVWDLELSKSESDIRCLF